MPESYAEGYTVWFGGFRVSGTLDLYAYVDSWNGSVPTGGVLESNEANNRADLMGIQIGGVTLLGQSDSQPKFPPRQLPK
jgi:hypothetical protein